ncbi:sulfite exporter TauE/SafE family protein [Gulosibacter sp. 10]|uniref:sulfite exporter TauE/SafE family protein n=1 Tax=Gulosibacter sp. 10 TaxID=1255570 RepID=UPI00097EC63C|nr:sulfite exporter TauE/SafE family protein [Gulosibacter sp. 10]SJM50059.1 putative membrane protein [Gulosibacter sp. 10]
MHLALVPLALAVGLLVGGVGVGGVVLPPALTWLFGMTPHDAAGTSMWSFLFTCAVGTIVYGRSPAMDRRMTGLLALGAAPAAVAGALANGVLPGEIALVPLGVFTLVTGVWHLCFRARAERRRAEEGAARPRMGALAAVSLGVFIGFCSAITGTGGPVLLIPILLIIGIPAVTAVAAAQLVSLPLVLCATAGYAVQGGIDYGMGTLIGALAAVGALLGARLALRMPQRVLHRVTAGVLVGIGALVLANAALG